MDVHIPFHISMAQVNAKAAEHKRIDALSDLLPPGTKIQIKGATVRMGVIMLEPKNVKVGVH